MSPATAPRDGDDGSVDVEAAWADIVSRWDADERSVGAWPASEDSDPEDSDPEASGAEYSGAKHSDVATGPRAEPLPAPDTDGGETDVDDWDLAPSHVGGERVREAAAAPDLLEDDEGYVPPEPPPLPRGDLFTMLAWGGVLGAPLFFLVTALFWRSVPQILIVAAVAAFIAGFITLVLRMPESRDPDDPTDGAVV